MVRNLIHPEDALSMTLSLAQLSPCEHYAGNESFLKKAHALQISLQGAFDITVDCEDGSVFDETLLGYVRHAEAMATFVREHASSKSTFGIRVHDWGHAACQLEVTHLLKIAGTAVTYLVLPKANGVNEVQEFIAFVQKERAMHWI